MMKPCHDLAIVRPRKDVHARLFSALSDPRLVNYKWLATPNKPAVAEVVALGPGTSYGSGLDVPEVEIGDLVLFQEQDVHHEIGDGAERTVFIGFRGLLATIHEDAACPLKPLSNYVLTEKDTAAMTRVAFAGDVKLYLPDSVTSRGMQTNHSPSTQIRVHAERVISTGKGRFVRKTFVEPGCVPGDVLLFMKTMSLEVRLRGRDYTLTPWGEAIAVVDDVIEARACA
jgi:co-chaperonin GroES (HSP10)